MKGVPEDTRDGYEQLARDASSREAIIDPLCLVFKVSGTHFLFEWMLFLASDVPFFRYLSANEMIASPPL